MLRSTEDTSRILQKFLSGKGAPDDLLNIRKSIQTWCEIRDHIRLEKSVDVQGDASGCSRSSDWHNIDTLINRLTDLRPLADRIEMAVDDEELRRKDRLLDATGSEGEEIESPNILSTSALGSPPYGLKWRIKPGLVPECSLQ